MITMISSCLGLHGNTWNMMEYAKPRGFAITVQRTTVSYLPVPKESVSLVDLVDLVDLVGNILSHFGGPTVYLHDTN